MIRASIILAACLIAAGCKPAPTIKEKEEARTVEVAKLQGWDKFWSAPDRVTGAANQFGFHPTAYEAAGKTWRSTGGPVTIAGSMSETPNQVSFAAEGPAADKVDTIRFTLAAADKDTTKEAGERFSKLVRDYLFQAGIEADALMPAIAEGVAARGDLEGTPYTIVSETDPKAGTPVTIVTFTRTGASAPANSKPQGN